MTAPNTDSKLRLFMEAGFDMDLLDEVVCVMISKFDVDLVRWYHAAQNRYQYKYIQSSQKFENIDSVDVNQQMRR